MKSGERIADEMWRLNKDYGLRHFFGTDDNFFNDKSRTLEIVEKLARAQFERREAQQMGAMVHRGDGPRHARR